MNKIEYKKFISNNDKLRKKVEKDNYRLNLHLMPPTGWLNDPNGLCVIKGVNHIYYQYTPFSPTWGMKLWGHYSTQDWIKYKEHEAFLFPDIPEDKDGVYSGSAFVENNKVNYFYTGNVKYSDKEYDYILDGREQNVIKVISEDGVNYDKKEVLLKNVDYPKNMSTHVRDPKVFKIDNEYFMILGARTKNDTGCAILYKSNDLNNWEYHMEIYSSKKYGRMWECCDLVEIENRWFLICCPQGIEKEGINFENIYQFGYFPIEINFKKKTYFLGNFYELDRGFDIYAPQTFIDNKNRLVLIAWMGIPDAEYSNKKTIENGWQHALTLPRMLSRKDNKIIQKPLEEFKKLRDKEIPVSYKNSEEAEVNFTSIFEIFLEIENSKIFNLKIEEVDISYIDNIFYLSMNKNGEGRTKRAVALKELYNLHIYVDKSSIEIFINDGEEVFTSRFYPNDTNKFSVSIKNKGKIKCYELKSIFVENL